MDEEEEEEKDEKAVLEQVFGPSSSSSSSSEEEEEEEEKLQWVAIEQVKGLWICTNFLSHRHQTHLLSAINSHNWFTPTTNNNQAMLFGHLPPWAHHLSHLIRTSSASILPQPLLSREPFFDQMIVNMYLPGQGICPHVDLLRFQDAIAILSLESSCVMHFTPLHSDSLQVPVLLTPGSLVLMSGEARYQWKHQINRNPGFQLWQGNELEQSRRISITLRKLCPDP
ncbi:alkylated DNA repair protein alkB homolog 8 [Arachis ipaensis]|uniref:alkylated DNA repair protein alkB homolog 8 n=1 Tax=Arachis ipaensis TaxID=130454 RepID=UPI0007AF3377|nr:alkylated DNA repair protein alkB homolog 8 [Arachis ipaensis]